MKSLLLAGAMIVATGTCAFAQDGYWVVGNRATSKCEIVTSNPVINAHRRKYLVRNRTVPIARRRQAGPFDHLQCPAVGRTARKHAG